MRDIRENVPENLIRDAASAALSNGCKQLQQVQMHKSISYARCLCLVAATVLFLSACGPASDEPQPIPIVREAPKDELRPRKLSAAERLGATMRAGMAQPATPALAYTLPEGWEDLPVSQFRQVNLRVAGNPKAECYVTILPGAAGGLLDNVNRWRQQMNLEPTTEAELSQSPHLPLLGEDALLVTLEGTFGGMQGDQALENYKMVALVQTSAGESIFVKMTGPKAVLDQEMGRFEEFVASLHRHGSHGHEAGADETAAAAPAEATLAADLHWHPADHWQLAPAQPMRMATYTIGAGGETEVVLSSLPGDAGGIESNINRWRSQMGQAPLTAEEIGSLPRLTILGTPSPLVKIQGDYAGMGEGPVQAGYTMLAALCPLETQTIFVKMIGPEATVSGEIEHFVAFCESIHAGGH
jgi:hypothetical protein